MKDLSGRVALITGAARGIGRASSNVLAQHGATVVMTDVLGEEGAAAAEAICKVGGDAHFLLLDVTSENAWHDTLDAASGRCGPISILINNAGIGEIGTIEDTSFEQWKRVMAVNSDAVFLGTRAAVRHMKDHGGGSIINVSSIEGIVGNAVLTAYNASKGAVRLLTKSAALHCAQQGYGIRVNSIHPGFAETSLVADALPLAPEGFAEATLADIPMSRFANPEEIAKAIVFLASDESSYMTGSELVVDGGLTAH
ncbi:MAG: glucose 1-dehydrogenase [Pseudomonadota bacterium]